MSYKNHYIRVRAVNLRLVNGIQKTNELLDAIELAVPGVKENAQWDAMRYGLDTTIAGANRINTELKIPSSNKAKAV